MNKKTGIIVDGAGDFSSIRKRFHEKCKILKTDGPRGHNADPGLIAKRSKKQIGILKAFKCKRIIVLLDFENRMETYKEFFKKLSVAFNKIDVKVPVDIAVPNRMIENWYLSDVEQISAQKAFIRDNLKQKKYEGTHGKTEIKKCFVKGIKYSETKHGPQMFEIIRFDIARKNSKSFDCFLSLMAV